jgi:hypothetical protein
MSTLKLCDEPGCGAPSTGKVSADAHAHDVLYPGSLTSSREECDSCEAHRTKLRALMFERANARLERDIPIHRELTRLKGEQIELETSLKQAVTVRDRFLGQNSYMVFDKEAKAEVRKWSSNEAPLEYEKLASEVRSISDKLKKNEEEWNTTQAKGNEPI